MVLGIFLRGEKVSKNGTFSLIFSNLTLIKYVGSSELSLVVMRRLRLHILNWPRDLSHLIIYESGKHFLDTHCVQARGLDTGCKRLKEGRGVCL